MTAGIRVLHVDDDPDVGEVTAQFLERAADRLAVTTATSAAEGLDRLAEESFDCVVSDYQMPGTDGLEFLAAVREDDPDLPFILYTGKGSEAVAGEAITEGATDYLQKQTGTEQYELLANRVTNAVEQYRAARRAAALERVRAVLKDANQEIVRAETRAEIEERICAVVSDADPYAFAWVGEHDTERQTVVPRAAAGVGEDYLDRIEIATDDSQPEGPTARAVRTHELAVVQAIPDDADYDPWREPALARGYRSSAAIPLVYDGTLYGVLNVYADRTDAFDEGERELLRELGEDVARGISRTEVRAVTQRYERVVANLPVGVYRATAGTDGVVVDANPALADILGADSPDDLVGRPVADFYRDEDDRDELRDRLARTGVVERRELPARTLDGETVWTAVTSIRTEEADGTYVDGVVRDVTERKAERRDREWCEKRLYALFERSPDGVYVHDAAGEVLAANPTHADRLGRSRAAICETNVTDFEVGTDPETLRETWAAMDAGERRRLTGEHRRADGTTFAVATWLTRVAVDGEVRFVALARDVSDGAAESERP